MVLTSERESELYRRIITILGPQLDDLQSAGDAESAVTDAMRVLASASRELAERWNSRARFVRLPDKLLVNCFRHLDFNGQLTASAVCTRWRAVSLAEPSLWSTFRVGHSLIARKIEDLEKLEALFQRSSPAPLSINLVLSPSHEDLLRPHMWRMKSLAFSYSRHPTEDFLCLPAPQLEAFACRTRLFNVPSNFAGGLVRLKALELINFSLPVTCPALENLQHFSGYPWCNDDLIQLFALCPHLSSLSIHGGGRPLSELMAIFYALPASVNVLEIRRTSSCSLSYVDHFQHWKRHQFKRLFLEAVNDLHGPLKHFVRSHDLPWEMAMVDRCCTLRSCDGDGADIVFDSMDNFDPTSIPRMTPLLVRLVTLTLSARALGYFVTQPAAVRLPALTTFVLDLDTDNLRRGIGRDVLARLPVWGAGLMVGRLQHVLIRRTNLNRVGYKDSEESLRLLEWLFLEFPDALGVWFHYDSPVLARIEIVGDFDSRARNDYDTARLRAMAAEVLVGGAY